MELLKILGGLGAIIAVVVLVSVSQGESGSDGPAAKPAERSFASDTSSARFVAPPGD